MEYSDARDRAIEQASDAALESIFERGALDEALKVAVTEQIGPNWSGDVDPLTDRNLNSGLRGVLRCLIGNGLDPDPHEVAGGCCLVCDVQIRADEEHRTALAEQIRRKGNGHRRPVALYRLEGDAEPSVVGVVQAITSDGVRIAGSLAPWSGIARVERHAGDPDADSQEEIDATRAEMESKLGHPGRVIAGPAGHWYALLDDPQFGETLLCRPAAASDGVRFADEDRPAHPSEDLAGWYEPEEPAPGVDVDAIKAQLRGYEDARERAEVILHDEDAGAACVDGYSAAVDALARFLVNGQSASSRTGAAA
jgi:hypothetical protein